MVKAPIKRHSKSGREPVTIDLQAQAAKPAAAASGSKPETVRGPATKPGEMFSSEGPTSASSKPAPAAAKPAAPASPADQAKAAEPTKPADPAKPATASASVPPASSATTSSRDTSSSASTTSASRPSSASVPPANATRASREGRGFGSLLGAAVVGGVIALGGYALLHSTGMFGGSSSATDQAALDELRGQVETLRSQVQSAPPPADTSGLQQQVQALTGEIDGLKQAQAGAGGNGGEENQALTTRLDELAAQLQQVREQAGQGQAADLGPLNERLDALQAQVGSATQASGAEDQRLASLQQAIDALNQKVTEQANEPAVSLAIAASALKAAIDRGQPFQAELDTYAAVEPDAPEVAQLRDMAGSGVPTRSAIADELPVAAAAMVTAGREPVEGTGLAQRLWNSATEMVQVRPVGGDVQGNAPGAIVARLEAAVKAGNYEKALSEYDTLPQAAKDAGAGFVAKIRARQAADELIAQALAKALRAG